MGLGEALYFNEEFRKLDFDKYESMYLAKKSQSCRIKYFKKYTELNYLIFDEKKNKKEKREIIKKMIPGSEVYSKLRKMSFLEREVKQKMKPFSKIILNKKKILKLQKEVEELWQNYHSDLPFSNL